MRVLMTGGGTGGHVNPALAIAKYIMKQEPDSEIAFVGTSHGIENSLVTKEGFPLYHIEIQGLRRSLSLRNIKTLYLALTSVSKAKDLIREFKPDIAVGTGGYVCWPVIKAASELGIPTALHESNSIPGVAVKMLSKYVDVIFTNFNETGAYIKNCGNIIRVGNPLSSVFADISQNEARDRLGFTGKYRNSLVSCGGSLGAECINSEVLGLMRDYTSRHPDIHHIHSAGARNYPEVKAKFEEMGLDRFPNLSLVGYIYDMPLRLAAADVVINRAGAITLSELAALGKPCILIPSPHVTDNHQYKNAKVLSDAGAAVLIEERELKNGMLIDAVDNLINDREKKRIMSENLRRFFIADSNLLIYNKIKELVI